MKKLFLFAIAVLVTVYSTKAQPEKLGLNCASSVTVNAHYSKATALDSILKKYSHSGIPGLAMTVYSETEGWWEGFAGYAKTEDKTPMQACNLQYLQSVAKSYMAVAILQLYEQGKIKLDDPITKYLPGKYSRYIRNANQVTVRLLLNHNSGIPEYSDRPEFISYVINHPHQPFTTEFALSTIENMDLMFPPGSRHHYSNTNYELLALIADAITGDHAAFISKNIFLKLGLKNTFYRNDPVYLKNKAVVNSYWDVLNTGRPANITEIQKANVASFIGDDGIVCTTSDAVKFLKGLMEGKLLSASTLAEMQTWVNDDEGNPIYGLGLVHYEAGGIEGLGHSGGGIGGGCILVYVPAKKVYVFIATNFGTLFAGELAKKADEMKNEVLATLLQ